MLALAACSAMLRLALLGLTPNDPESRSPNASLELLGAAPPFDFRAAVVVVDGVRERGLGVFDAEAASMANASYFGRGAPDDGAGLAPSFRAGCEGFTGAEELQRSEKESDIVIDRLMALLARSLGLFACECPRN